MIEKTAEVLARENAQLRGDLLTIGTRVSHDLRTPLGGILNAAELLKEIFAEEEQAKEPLASLFSAVDEMMRLIKSVGLMAKASAHPLPLEKIRMADAVCHAHQRLERQLSKSGAILHLAGSWPEVAGVREWLEFIWWGLLSNALRHGGKKIELGWREEQGGHKFFVRDNGDAVAPERRGKLFQSFDELHRPDSARGLGLAMVRRLVELQNGVCGYENDGGSVFFFVLPFANPSVAGMASRNIVVNCEEAIV